MYDPERKEHPPGGSITERTSLGSVLPQSRRPQQQSFCWQEEVRGPSAMNVRTNELKDTTTCNIHACAPNPLLACWKFEPNSWNNVDKDIWIRANFQIC